MEKREKNLTTPRPTAFFPPDIDASYTHHIRIIGEPKEKYRRMVVQP